MSKASTPNTTSRGCFAATGDLFGPRADIAVPAIAPKPATALPIVFAEDVTRAVNFARQSKAPSTRRAYRDAFDVFRAWCRPRRTRAPCPS
jgi:hypothetical protein